MAGVVGACEVGRSVDESSASDPPHEFKTAAQEMPRHDNTTTFIRCFMLGAYCKAVAKRAATEQSSIDKGLWCWWRSLS